MSGSRWADWAGLLEIEQEEALCYWLEEHSAHIATHGLVAAGADAVSSDELYRDGCPYCHRPVGSHTS